MTDDRGALLALLDQWRDKAKWISGLTPHDDEVVEAVDFTAQSTFTHCADELERLLSRRAEPAMSRNMPTVKTPEGFPACVSLRIKFNPHASEYQSLAEWLKNEEERGEGCFWEWASDEEKALSLASGDIWICQWYPDTPIGFYALSASTFTALMRAVLSRAP
jgi:hypothetical protein